MDFLNEIKKVYNIASMALAKSSKNTQQYNDIMNYLDVPVASYVYNSNKEVQPTAVNQATGVFTAPSHGFVNGNVIAYAHNQKSGLKASMDDLPTGMQAIRYYVVNATTDTFGISATAGGAPVTFTTSGAISKWHFEKLSTQKIAITGLPKLNKARIRAKLIMSSQNWGIYIYPNDCNLASLYSYPCILGLKNYSVGLVTGIIEASDVHTFLLDVQSYFFDHGNGTINTTFQNIVSQGCQLSVPIETLKVEPNDEIAFLNGTMVEVFRA